jgi:hypothetical protein
VRRSLTAGLTAERAPRDDTNRHELVPRASGETVGNAPTDTPEYDAGHRVLVLIALHTRGVAGSNPVPPTIVISQEIGNGLNLWFGPFRFGFGSFWCSGGLVVVGPRGARRFGHLGTSCFGGASVLTLSRTRPRAHNARVRRGRRP